MPNHCYFIVETVGVDIRVCPSLDSQNHQGECCKNGEYTGSPLHRVVQWFKTMATNEYIRAVKKDGWQRFDNKLWQKNYWEYIIRNANEFNCITQYIIENPLK